MVRTGRLPPTLLWQAGRTFRTIDDLIAHLANDKRNRDVPHSIHTLGLPGFLLLHPCAVADDTHHKQRRARTKIRRKHAYSSNGELA